MSGKLNTFVHVHHNGESKAYGPADAIPNDVARLITNPNVWETTPTLVEKVVEPETPTGDQSGTGGSGSTPTEVPIPPKGGKGSSAAAWAAYAASRGFAIEDEDVKASDIIAALAEEGIPTE